MAESKSKKGKKRSDERLAEPIELVLTISKGEVISIEALDDAGKRIEVSEREFAELSGEDEMEDLEAALEEAYAAGIGDVLEESVEAEFDDEDQRLHNAIVREAAARQLLRSGVRRLILRRALQRGSGRKPKFKRPRANHNGAEEEASKA